MSRYNDDDISRARKGKGQVVAVIPKTCSTTAACQDIMEGLLRDVIYARSERQSFMESNFQKDCTCIYIDITVRRGRTYKRKRS